MASERVERGVIIKIFTTDAYITGNKPIILQAQSVKYLEPRRCRVVLTDGIYACQAVLKPQSGDEPFTITKGDIVSITKYELELVGAVSKHVIISEICEVLEAGLPPIGVEKAQQVDGYLNDNPELDMLLIAKNLQNGAVDQKSIITPAPLFAQPQPPSHSALQNKLPQQRGAKGPDNLCLIEQLSPYQNVWTLKARVSYKGDLRTWSNAKGTGKLFNVNFLDESGEIRATAFNENAEKYHHLLQENKVYYISKARIQNAKKQFSNLDNPYELSLDKDSEIKEAEDSGNVPTLKYDFVKLNKIQELESDSIIDIIGVVKEVNQPFQITSKAGKAYDRRDILIVDDSQFAISVGLWNTPAPLFAQPQPPSHSALQNKLPQQRGAKGPDNLCLIEQLSPYQNVWTLKARVSYKGDLRTWSNAKGTGKLFNVNFLDESGEIRATAFNENAEKYHHLLQENKVYYISKARIQNAKKQFSNLDNPYELSLDKDSEIKEAEDSGNVPTLKYDFVKLNKIQELESDSIIDIIGVVKEVNQPFQITSKAGKAYDRRDILIVDDSQFAISVGLWNVTALNFDIPEGSVVAIKGCKVSDFGGKTLSLTPSANITQNPEINEAYLIKGWYDGQGRGEQFKSLKAEPGTRKTSPADRKKISEIIALETQLSEKPDYHNVKATVSFVRSENFSYAACSSEGCSKKVTDNGDGTWRCEKCDVNHAQPRYRYILTLSIVDETGNLWITLFDDQAQSLMGVSANELMALKEDDPAKVAEYFENLQMREFEFRIRGRLDSYNGNERVRYSGFAANKIDYSAESSYLVEKFEKMGL